MNPPRVLFVGRTTLDALYWLDRLPEEDTKVYARQSRIVPGGPSLNAAITHSLLGGRAMLLSAVGSGPWAAPVRAELDRLGIRFLDLAEGTPFETPLTTVLVSAASCTRTIVNPPLSTLSLPSLPASWEAAIPAAWGGAPSVVLSDGFFIEQTAAFLGACRNAGAAICLDGGSWKPGTAELAPLLTAAICSERFAPHGFEPGPDGVFAWFADRGVPYVAVTRGAKSILASENGRRFEVEVAPVEAGDTLGAGDVLHGAFCHHFAIGLNFEAALRRASAIATLSCQSLGIEGWATNRTP